MDNSANGTTNNGPRAVSWCTYRTEPVPAHGGTPSRIRSTSRIDTNVQDVALSRVNTDVTVEHRVTVVVDLNEDGHAGFCSPPGSRPSSQSIGRPCSRGREGIPSRGSSRPSGGGWADGAPPGTDRSLCDASECRARPAPGRTVPGDGRRPLSRPADSALPPSYLSDAISISFIFTKSQAITGTYYYLISISVLWRQRRKA